LPFADAYATYAASRERIGDDPMGILPVMLEHLGDLAGCHALDAGCGEGYLARILAGRGARVTGVDISPRLIGVARRKDPGGTIDYRVADLSKWCPDLDGRFDVVGIYLALNDVADSGGFTTTVARALKPGGRAVLALNNPYA
jgi:2-polyprenyl-3-methyl-5-hydroxy-6-metoxy-1,4-benzoquinol methylase